MNPRHLAGALRLAVAVAVAAAMVCACDPSLTADLTPPTLVSTSLGEGRTLNVSVAPRLIFEFSEPLAPAFVGPEFVYLVPFEVEGECWLAPRCEDTACVHGTCQADPVTSAAARAVAAGTGRDGACVEIQLLDGPGGPNSVVEVQPCVTLIGHRQYTLLIGGLRDVSGAAFAGRGEADVLQRTFVTADSDSGGPSPILLSPAANTSGVPTNLDRVQTGFRRPVTPSRGAALYLEAQDGTTVLLEDPKPCVDALPGHCWWWDIAGGLTPGGAYRLAGGTLHDGAGRAAKASHDPPVFWMGHGPDLTPPSTASLKVGREGECVVARYQGELVNLTLAYGDESRTAEGQEIVLGFRERGSTTLRATLTDLAGNESEMQVHVEAASPEVGLVQVSEVLANPLGPEPAQEFVEVFVGPTPVPLLGLFVADQSPWEIEQAVADGEEPPGDALPDVTLAPGAVAVIVSDAFVSGAGGDEPVAPGAQVIRVDASLGDGGLKNVGEAVTLYRADPFVVVSSYGNFIDTSPGAHAGRSVARRAPGACDLPGGWASSAGMATPGRLP